MKKIISLFVVICMFGALFAGCDGKERGVPYSTENLSIVTTIFPEYDWVREITNGNENVEITMLLDNGVDLHSFQPTAEDIIKISSCDMFVYVGGESDQWVENALASVENKNMVVINLLDVLGNSVKEEELVEGMEAGEHEHHDGEEAHEHEGEEHHEDGEEAHHHDEEEPEMDEHVWLSLKNSETICNAIAEGLSKVDSANKELYASNAEAYVEKLRNLDKKYEKAVKEAAVKTVVFGDRFPFRYMVDDYGIEYYAAFVGCSAESEASFETITFLSRKVDELNLGAILQIESSDGKIAKAVRDNSKKKDQQILTLDSMQATTSKDVENGTTYLSVMEGNLKVLEQALN